MDRWVGKVAVVTGASAGIGSATAAALVEHGLVVVGIARRVQKIEELATELKGEEGKLYARRCDVGNEKDLTETYAWIKSELGGIDVLVNNAGIARFMPVSECTNEMFGDILNVNVKAIAIGIREAVKSMKERDVPGHIINVSSTAGHSVNGVVSRMNLYTASKFAVTAMTETVRKELAGPGAKIKVTNLSPGLVKTEIIGLAGVADEEEFYTTKLHLLPEHLADTIIYLLSTPPSVQICELIIRPLGEE